MWLVVYACNIRHITVSFRGWIHRPIAATLIHHIMAISHKRWNLPVIMTGPNPVGLIIDCPNRRKGDLGKEM